MAEAAHGYIKLSRKQFDGNDLLWEDPSPFDVRSAWVWLLQAAAWKDGVYRTSFGSDWLKRGEFVASVRFLAVRWGWSKSSVSRFLAKLESTGRISKVSRDTMSHNVSGEVTTTSARELPEKCPDVGHLAGQSAGRHVGQHGAVYLIANYDTYQSGNGKSGTRRGTLGGTATDAKNTETRDKVEGIEGKTTNTYPADFEMLFSAYPKKPGANKREAFRQYEARLRDGCSFDAMFEGTKAYNAYCVSQGFVGTKYVKGPEVFFGRDRHFASDWTVSAPQQPARAANDRASRMWSGMKRTKVLFSVNADDWQSRMADMVSHGEADSVEQLRSVLKSVNRTQLQDARNDHFAIQQIADALPPNLKIA